MPRAIEIPKHNVLDFKDNLILGLQQKGTKLSQWIDIDEELAVGESASLVDILLPTEGQQKTGRDTDTPINGTARDRRWAQPYEYEWGDLINKTDKIRQMSDPTSKLTLNALLSLGRQLDKAVIFPAFFGAASSGKTGTASTDFDTDDVVDKDIGGAGTGFNVAKLQAASTRLMLNENEDDDQATVFITANEHDYLLSDLKNNQNNITREPVFVNGRISFFMGFNIVIYNPIPIVGALREIPALVRSGVMLKHWENPEVHAAPRVDKKFNNQLYVAFTAGAVRTQEGKVVKIETPTAPSA